MSKSKLVIQHDLSKLSPEQVTQYLRDVSEFIGLDPDLNGLDTIWMENENGPGKSLAVYARRGTAEILRSINNIEVSSLTSQITSESAIFTAVGRNGQARQEIAIGSKSLRGLSGKAYDNAVMTASTRALRRLTMQFTKLGILDESEIESIQGSTVNPAAGATLQGSPMVIPPMPKLTNNAPGKDVTLEKVIEEAKKFPDLAPVTITAPAPPAPSVVINTPSAAPVTLEQHTATQQALRDDAKAQLDAKGIEEPAKTKRPRRKSNTVSLEGPEPEVVQSVRRHKRNLPCQHK